MATIHLIYVVFTGNLGLLAPMFRRAEVGFVPLRCFSWLLCVLMFAPAMTASALLKALGTSDGFAAV